MGNETEKLLEEITNIKDFKDEAQLDSLFEKCDRQTIPEKKYLFLEHSDTGKFLYLYMQSDPARYEHLIKIAPRLQDWFANSYLKDLLRASSASNADLSKSYLGSMQYVKKNPVIAQFCIMELIRSVSPLNTDDANNRALEDALRLLDELEDYDFNKVCKLPAFRTSKIHNIWAVILSRNIMLYKCEYQFLRIVDRLMKNKCPLESTMFATPISGLARSDWSLKNRLLANALNGYARLDETSLCEAIKAIVQKGQHMDYVQLSKHGTGCWGEYHDNTSGLKNNVIALSNKLQSNPGWNNIFLSDKHNSDPSDRSSLAYILCHDPEYSSTTDIRHDQVPLRVNLAAVYFLSLKGLIDQFLTDEKVSQSPANHIVALTALAMSAKSFKTNYLSHKILHYLAKSSAACTIINEWGIRYYARKGFTEVHSKLHRNLDNIGKAINQSQIESLLLDNSDSYPSPLQMAKGSNNAEFFRFILENIYPTASKEFKNKINESVMELQDTASPNELLCIKGYLESYLNEKYWFVPKMLMPAFSATVSNRGKLLEEIKETSRNSRAATPSLTH